MRKPTVTRLGPLRIPLFWDRKGDKKLIGWFYPVRDIITTVKGTPSSLTRANLNKKHGLDMKNLAHGRRAKAAYASKDYTYSGT